MTPTTKPKPNRQTIFYPVYLRHPDALNLRRLADRLDLKLADALHLMIDASCKANGVETVAPVGTTTHPPTRPGSRRRKR